MFLKKEEKPVPFLWNYHRHLIIVSFSHAALHRLSLIPLVILYSKAVYGVANVPAAEKSYLWLFVVTM